MLDVDAGRAKGPLQAVQDSGRHALGELRRLLSVLRPETERATPLAPQPGVADLSRLADNLRDAGIEVELDLEADSTSLPSGVDLAAFRIVQEALTNVLKHSSASHVTVVVRCHPNRIELEVADNGPGPFTINVDGHGLVGMRERVSAYGGQLFCGPRPQGGYVVSAQLEIPTPR